VVTEELTLRVMQEVEAEAGMAEAEARKMVMLEEVLHILMD